LCWCNHCITSCGFQRANISIVEKGENKIYVQPEYCITCRECVKSCAPKARLFYDDTEKFFNEIQSGKDISLIVDSAFKTNFKDYKKVLGWLKSLGIKNICDASFGAEITSWGYIKYMQQHQKNFWVSSTCPVTVNNL